MGEAEAGATKGRHAGGYDTGWVCFGLLISDWIEDVVMSD